MDYANMKPILLVAALAAALPAQAANVVVTPGGIAGYLYLNQQSAGASGAATPIDCNAGFVSNYTKTFAAGEVTGDIKVNYWMKGGGGGGGGSNGGKGASVMSSFVIPAGYTGSLKIYVGRGGGTFVPNGTDDYVAGNGGDGYAGGGGGGAGYVPCVGCEVMRWGGGGGGSSAILLGTSRIAIAGGGGGGSGGYVAGSAGGDAVGASGGGGGGFTGAVGLAVDATGGIWNGTDPASVGGAGNAYVWSGAAASPCTAHYHYVSGPGSGGINGGGGGGGGGATQVSYAGSCTKSYGGGGGGGGGAGGGGGGSGSYSTVEFTSVAGLAGGNGGVIGNAGGNAPDLIASASAQYGGFGGTTAGGVGGNRIAGTPAPQAAVGLYSSGDPYLFLSDKGLGGKGSPAGSALNTSGTSGGVFLKYSFPECIIKNPL